MTEPRRYDPVKRALDVVGASLLLVILSPVLGVVAIMVVVGLGRPVLFRQARPGRGGRVFTLTKFRTMRTGGADAGVESDAARLTGLGRILRSTSLDELPTLVNVVRGDMSMVGPRPLLVSYLERYSPEQARRHDVRPGVTGLAQVSGRNALTWEAKFDLDVRYCDTRSFALDASILLRTLSTVLRRSGISGRGSATATEFRGSSH